MNANEHLDFYNPDSIYYGNSRHYIQQLENKVRQQQAEIERLQRLCESYIRSDYEGTSMFKPFMEELYGKAQEK